MKIIFIVAVCMALFFGCSNPCPNCGCDNVDDCLSKYKFEEARKYASKLSGENYHRNILGSTEERNTKNEEMFKIISAEANYWITQSELEKAENVSYELTNFQLNFQYGAGDRINQEELEQKYLELNSRIITKYCEKQKFEDAEALVIKLPEKIMTVIEKDIYPSTLSYTDKDIDRCRKVYQAIKKGLQENQEIEPFKETGRDIYKITTNKYPRKEALKIIEEYKKAKL